MADNRGFTLHTCTIICHHYIPLEFVCMPHQQAHVGLSATSQDHQPRTTAPPQSQPELTCKINPLRVGKHFSSEGLYVDY